MQKLLSAKYKYKTETMVKKVSYALTTIIAISMALFPVTATEASLKRSTDATN